jgi:hypothetical protein
MWKAHENLYGLGNKHITRWTQRAMPRPPPVPTFNLVVWLLFCPYLYDLFLFSEF